MRYLICLILAVAVIAFAFHYAKPLPSTNFDETFLPKADYVKYVAAGNDASVAGLFCPPYIASKQNSKGSPSITGLSPMAPYTSKLPSSSASTASRNGSLIRSAAKTYWSKISTKT